MLRMTGSILLAGTLLVSLAPVTGCESAGDVMGGSGGAAMQNVVSSMLGDWTLAAIGGGDLASVGADRVPTMNIASDGTASGFAGVNRWSSVLDLDALAAGKFDLGHAATTKMAGSPAAMDLESRFLSALGGVTGFDVRALSDGV
ncbi:MAG: META domain-containing protein, partial [Phycisphaerales bacterium JB041]